MPAHRCNRFARAWTTVILTAVLMALGPALAMAAAPYEVMGVPVDVTAADAATARDQAIVEGQRKAFTMLMERLVGTEQAASIPTPDDAQLSSMVQDFEVESERLSSVRYIGVMTFRFDAAAVDAAMGRPSETTGGIVTDAVPSGPVRTLSVVVPITSLRDWVEVRRRLSGIALVQRAEVRSLARTEGELNLSYHGDETGLRQALAQRQLSLLQDPQQQQWLLQLSEYGGAATGNP
jgi:Uncharacterized protein conserved in bacteria (DUF2066)